MHYFFSQVHPRALDGARAGSAGSQVTRKEAERVFFLTEKFEFLFVNLRCVVGKDYPIPIVDHALAAKVNGERMRQVYQRLSAFKGPQPQAPPQSSQNNKAQQQQQLQQQQQQQQTQGIFKFKFLFPSAGIFFIRFFVSSHVSTTSAAGAAAAATSADENSDRLTAATAAAGQTGPFSLLPRHPAAATTAAAATTTTTATTIPTSGSSSSPNFCFSTAGTFIVKVWEIHVKDLLFISCSRKWTSWFPPSAATSRRW